MIEHLVKPHLWGVGDPSWLSRTMLDQTSECEGGSKKGSKEKESTHLDLFPRWSGSHSRRLR